MKNKNEKGSSMIELIIVIAVIGILIGLASLDTDIFYNYKLNKEIENFKRDIESMRIRSIKEGRRTKVSIAVNEKSYMLWTMDDSNSFKKTKTVYLKYVRLSSEQYDYIFTGRGSISRGNTIRLKHKYGEYKMTVEPITGKVNIGKE